MNIELFNEFMKRGNRPSQNYPEFLIFLEFCEGYFKKKRIKSPTIVELGAWRNKQKKFYEEFLGAEHVSIDISDRGRPDIKGNTHDPETLKALRKKFGERPIDLLFIDAGHDYESVKRDFEIYSPLCRGIIAFHDIHCHRYDNREVMQVWRFWDELKLKAYTGRRSYKDFLFLDIFHYRGIGNGVQMGIGIIIKP